MQGPAPKAPHGTGDPCTDRVKLGNGVTINYAYTGEGNSTPIVFLHGFADSWKSFASVINALPRRRTVALDMRGHGDSDKPERGYSLEDFTQDLRLFMDTLGLQKVSLTGHSLGSLIAQSFAARHPHRVERLILIGSAPATVENEMLRDFKPAVDGLRDPVPREFVSDFQATTNPVPAAFMEMIISEAMKVPARVWRSVFSELLRIDNRAVLGAITSPTLLLHGSRDMVFPGRDQEALLASIPDSRLEEFDAGHATHWEKPEAVAAAIDAFVPRDEKPDCAEVLFTA